MRLECMRVMHMRLERMCVMHMRLECTRVMHMRLECIVMHARMGGGAPTGYSFFCITRS